MIRLTIKTFIHLLCFVWILTNTRRINFVANSDTISKLRLESLWLEYLQLHSVEVQRSNLLIICFKSSLKAYFLWRRATPLNRSSTMLGRIYNTCTVHLEPRTHATPTLEDGHCQRAQNCTYCNLEKAVDIRKKKLIVFLLNNVHVRLHKLRT